MVKGKPTLPDIVDTLRQYLAGTVSVCHTHFDRVALQQACERYRISPISTTWLDSARVARRTWKEVAYSGYGLADVCKRIGYEFKHHDALEDAKAAAHVLLSACTESSLGLDEWQRRVNLPIDPNASPSGRIHRDGDPEGYLYGEVLVFTGELELTRVEAADLAARVGCTVDPGVTKRTTLLVLGTQSSIKLKGREKSAKQRKAEQLIAAGQCIRIVTEAGFREFVKAATGAH